MKPKLIQGPVGRMLCQLTIPMFWGLLSIVIFNLVDAYFVAQLGTTHLAAVSFTFPIIMILFNCAFGIGIGMSTVVALAAGEGDRSKVQALMTNGLFLTILLIGLLAMVGLLTMDLLFSALGAKGYLLGLVKQYMSYIYFGVVLASISIVGNNGLRAIGNTFWPGIIMAVSAIVNLILDPILIFGYFGLPRMELEGAALATLISWIFTFFSSAVIIYYKERLLCFSLETRAQMFQCWRSILFVAIPAAWTNLILPLSIAIVTAMLASFGEWAVAAFGVATRIESLAHTVLISVSAVIGPFIGQNWAAQKRDRILKAVRLTFSFSIAFGLFLAGLLALTSNLIVPLFDSNPKVIEAANQFFLVAPIGYAGYGIVLIVCSGYNALRRPYTSSMISMIRAFVLYIPLALWFKNIWGPMGIFASASVANLLTAALGGWMFYRFCKIKPLH